MQNYLVVSALLENSDNVILKFSKLSKNSGCSVIDSRFTILGQEISVMLFLSGTWDAIAKVEDMLAKLEKTLDTRILTKRTKAGARSGDAMPYAIDVVGADRSGMIFEITDFIAANELSIQEMSSNTYQASQTATNMFSLHMIVNIPVDSSIAALRGEFIDFCDRLNLDAIMEPVK